MSSPSIPFNRSFYPTSVSKFFRENHIKDTINDLMELYQLIREKKKPDRMKTRKKKTKQKQENTEKEGIKPWYNFNGLFIVKVIH